tara:strand:+ start:81 stop:269 length:189 start_codon:yes stop_codon:yes gene_type:complete
MENLLTDTLPKEVIEIQEALPPLPEPEPEGIGVGGCIGIAALVLVGAAVCAKLYKCTGKKKQ